MRERPNAVLGGESRASAAVVSRFRAGSRAGSAAEGRRGRERPRDLPNGRARPPRQAGPRLRVRAGGFRRPARSRFWPRRPFAAPVFRLLSSWPATSRATLGRASKGGSDGSDRDPALAHAKPVRSVHESFALERWELCHDRDLTRQSVDPLVVEPQAVERCRHRSGRLLRQSSAFASRIGGAGRRRAAPRLRAPRRRGRRGAMQRPRSPRRPRSRPDPERRHVTLVSASISTHRCIVDFGRSGASRGRRAERGARDLRLPSCPVRAPPRPHGRLRPRLEELLDEPRLVLEPRQATRGDETERDGSSMPEASSSRPPRARARTCGRG